MFSQSERWRCQYPSANVVECKRNVMAHAQKPDSVFQRNGRVHLYRRGCQFSRVLAFFECGSADNDCSNTGWTVPSQTEACLATHSIRLFPLHFSSRASPCATRFRFHSTILHSVAIPIKSLILVSRIDLNVFPVSSLKYRKRQMFNETLSTRLSRLLSGPNKWFCLGKGSAKKWKLWLWDYY